MHCMRTTATASTDVACPHGPIWLRDRVGVSGIELHDVSVWRCEGSGWSVSEGWGETALQRVPSTVAVGLVLSSHKDHE